MIGMEEEKALVIRKKPNILVTGTPGVGKTTHAKLLCEYIPELQYISVGKKIMSEQIDFLGELVNQQKLYTEWNNEFDCPIADDDMVVDYLEFIHEEGGYVVEFHTSGMFPERWFDLVVLLRCDNTPLYDRLKARGYAEKKITENLDCEILEVTADEAKDSYKPEIIMELRSDSEEDVEKNLSAIIEWVKAWAEQRKDKDA